MARTVQTPDVLIVGGGVMGCATALELATRGHRPLVLERSVPGAEASSAAAGMLGAQVEASRRTPLFELCIGSRDRFGPWCARLTEATGIDVQFRPCGVVRVTLDAAELNELQASLAWQRDVGQRALAVDGDAARRIEPGLSLEVVGGVHMPDDARVDPPSLLRALRIAAEREGVAFRSGALVRRLVHNGDRVEGVKLDDDEQLVAEHVVLAAGSWSSLVSGLDPVPLAGKVRPARGQIVELRLASPPIRRIVFSEGAYLSPRDDGRVLVGSTLEFVGYKKGVTARAVRDLIAAAIALVPALEDAEVSGMWSNFRPYAADELPLIGATNIRGLWLATGHYRNGILLAPLTAELIADGLEGKTPSVDLTPFRAERLQA